MTYKTPSGDIIVQEGTFGYSFIASGTISAGQLVKPNGIMEVVKCTIGTDNVIGVAAYGVTKGEAVTVYGPGNIVRCHSPSGLTQGDDLYPGNDGCVDDTPTYGGIYPCIGIALESTASGSVRVLLK